MKNLLSIFVRLVIIGCSADSEQFNGPWGPKEDPGEQGPAGTDGQDGQDGDDGVDGKDGTNGVYSSIALPLKDQCAALLDEYYARRIAGNKVRIYFGFDDCDQDEDHDGYLTGDEYQASWDPSNRYSPAPASLISGDYDGDGSAEVAIFRPVTGLWAVRGVTRCYFGMNGDWPVAGRGQNAPNIYE